ncbi:MAG: DUF1361 domain-containing protein [Thermosynechococcaceae cyanobacterium]
MEQLLGNALGLFNRYSGWIIWNLFLAFIPLALSFWLFRRREIVRSPLWWLVLVVFIAFLPNAPYLLTDIMHLIRAIRAIYSIWIITLIFIPLHVFAILAGFEAYVIALINQGIYLKRQGAQRFVFGAELLVHALSAVGVYVGRFQRFNSWDLVTDPGYVLLATLNNFTSRFPIVVMLITFVVITVLYWIVKQITLGLVLQMRYGRQPERLKSPSP